MTLTQTTRLDWVYLGAEVVCREPYVVDLSEVDVQGTYTIEKGTKAKVIDFQGSYVLVGYFDFFGPNDRLPPGINRRNGYVQYLRGDLVHYWGPGEETPQRAPVQRPIIPMDVATHPDMPGDANEKGYRFIGYWATSEDPATCAYAQKGLALPWPADFIDHDWDEQEREAVAMYLDEGTEVFAWRGFPCCRLGCQTLETYTDAQGAEALRMCLDLGTTCKGDGVYVWPAGFSHYLRVHHVRPPAEFVEHVIQRITQIVKAQSSTTPDQEVPCEVDDREPRG